MYYQILDHLPQVPQHFIDKIMNNIDNLNFDEYMKGRRTPVAGNKMFPRSPVEDDLKDWIITHITDRGHLIDVAVTDYDNNKVALRPHTDRTREYTLMYLLKTGGDDHRTVFYKPKDTTINVVRNMDFDYNELNEIDSIHVPLYTWTLLHAVTVHSVENIPGMRVAIQIGLEENFVGL
jgi:hypothetical protein